MQNSTSKSNFDPLKPPQEISDSISSEAAEETSIESSEELESSVVMDPLKPPQ